MARRIGVLEVNSKKVQTYVKKSVAELLVRRLLAVWVGSHAIQRVLVRQIDANAPERPSCRVFIPERMPPVEIGGCHFIEPESATWREAHRKVSFGHAE